MKNFREIPAQQLENITRLFQSDWALITAGNEENDRLSLCFLPEEYRAALQLCGKESGRDMDKFAAAGLTPAFLDGVPFVAESRLIVFCRKIYVDDLRPECFLDKEPLRYYEAGDFHRVYTCEIEKILIKD